MIIEKDGEMRLGLSKEVYQRLMQNYPFMGEVLKVNKGWGG
jgi:hypothetical protein